MGTVRRLQVMLFKEAFRPDGSILAKLILSHAQKARELLRRRSGAPSLAETTDQTRARRKQAGTTQAHCWRPAMSIQSHFFDKVAAAVLEPDFKPSLAQV
jgi:hypothetical protein